VTIRRQGTPGSRALRRALRQRQLTLEDAADLLGAGTQTVWQWVHGVRRPSLRWAAAIETEFGIGYRTWLDETTLSGE